MNKILVGADDAVGAWVMGRQQNPGSWIPGQGYGFGVTSGNELIGGAVFDSWNGASIHLHVAGDAEQNWISRAFLAIVFDYPFNQLQVKKIICLIGEGNVASRRFCGHIGFKLEATLSEAHPDGMLLVYTMTREQCRWLSLAEKEPWRVKTESPART